MGWETEEDRAKQRAVAVRLAKAWELRDIVEFPKYAVLDYHLLRDTGNALVEIKCRNNSSLYYPTLIISRSKMDRCAFTASELCTRFFLVIEWTDGIFWVELDRTDFSSLRQRMGGRPHPTDPSEYEVVYEIPINSFRKLREPDAEAL